MLKRLLKSKNLLRGLIVLLVVAALLNSLNERPDAPQTSEVQPATATTVPPTPTSAPTPTPLPPTPTPSPYPTDRPPSDIGIESVAFEGWRGFIGDWWQVYFNAPASHVSDGGLDVPLVDAIAAVQDTLDIAAFEINNENIVEAILDARQRGLQVRIVTDDEHGLHDKKDDALRRLQAAGIPVVDDQRSALMHNKFMIMDGETVWTGSWNYTFNGTYRNNNNVFVMHSAAAVEAYQAEFDEMFHEGRFGVRSPDGGIVSFTENGADISIIFAAEADEIPALTAEIEKAQEAIRIMTFVFSLDELADAMLERMIDGGVLVQGIFEKRNSTASWSQLPPLHCAGAHMRQDGNRYTLHHKVFIIDDHTVITGSFNYSNNAAKNNDENIVIVRSRDIARLYLDEWGYLWDTARELAPDEVVCR